MSDELERLRIENEAQAALIEALEDHCRALEADLELADRALCTCDDAYHEVLESAGFWKKAAIAYRDRAEQAEEQAEERAERAERELEWGWVDARTYEWNRAMVRYFLPTRPGMND